MRAGRPASCGHGRSVPRWAAPSPPPDPAPAMTWGSPPWWPTLTAHCCERSWQRPERTLSNRCARDVSSLTPTTLSPAAVFPPDLETGGGQRRDKRRTFCVRRADERRAQAADRAPPEIEACLDQDAALSGKDTGVDREQLAVQLQRRRHIAGKVSLDHPLCFGPAEVSGCANHADSANRQQWQR